MPACENRRQPRARADKFAEVELRAPRHRRVQATISSASTQGMGLSLLGRHSEEVVRGRTVTIRFALGAETVQLPAKVAWNRPGPAGGDAGVRVHLEIAGATMRRSYLTWLHQLLHQPRA